MKYLRTLLLASAAFCTSAFAQTGVFQSTEHGTVYVFDAGNGTYTAASADTMLFGLSADALTALQLTADNTGCYQPLNSSFDEPWTLISWKKLGKTYEAYEPMHWHGFASVTGALASAAQNNKQMGKTAQAHSGDSAVYICASSVLGVVANGNLTNGHINGGSSNALDATGNYNFMDPADDENFVMHFNGRPDSIAAWTKFSAAIESQTASMSCELLRNQRYQTPEVDSIAGAHDAVIAQAEHLFQRQNGYTRISAPLEYEADEEPEMILITFTTSSVPGVGSLTDSMLVDDVEMIYNSELASLKIDGEEIRFSNRSASTLKPYATSYQVEVETNGQSAHAFIGYDETESTMIILVAGGDYAANPRNFHRYAVGFGGTQPQSALENAKAGHATKLMRDGRIIIVRGNQAYDLLGNRIN